MRSLEDQGTEIGLWRGWRDVDVLLIDEGRAVNFTLSVEGQSIVSGVVRDRVSRHVCKIVLRTLKMTVLKQNHFN